MVLVLSLMLHMVRAAAAVAVVLTPQHQAQWLVVRLVVTAQAVVVVVSAYLARVRARQVLMV